MLKSCLFFVFVFCALLVGAQDSTKVILSGSIKDSETGEGLIGSTIIAKSGVGAIADLEGNFILKLPKGEYVIEVSMLGYGKFIQKIKLYSNKKIDVQLESNTLDEVEVVANVAQIRETPVAFSSISATKIQEELGGKDISLIANTTPGAYATSQGGGAGDSRVTIRGFDQRNIGVLVDGIPVNDMESGQVYWSNWDGLKDITKSMQIQRGLGASKLAISSIGGTMNFITTGIEGKQQLVVKKEWANNRGNVMSMAYNSGLINNKWGFTLAGTYRNGDGWAEQTWYSAYSYFAKVQFMPNPRHIISVGVNGAPQSHGSRSSKVPIAVYDRAYAEKLGVAQDTTLWKNGITPLGYTTEYQGDRSLRWSADQGVLDKTTGFNDKTNVFHKPLFNINHFWKISEKTTISTVAYASLGTGGGTGFFSSFTTRDTLTGYYIRTSPPANLPTAAYNPGERRATNFIRMQNNDHKWFGVLSTATSKLNKLFTLTYGIDLRYYVGHHYNTVYNLLGGDYYEESGTNKNPNVDYLDKKLHFKRKNDLYGANWNSTVKWGGLFSQVEFKKGKWSAFFTATGSKSAYNRIDYYKKKDLVINGQKFDQAIQFGETFYYNGSDQITAVRGATVTSNGDTTFIKNPGLTKVSILNATGYDIDSKEARASNTGWVWQLGYTVKGGANYNINDHHNVFVNIGVMQIPQRLDNTFTFGNRIINGFKPQYIQSYEMGYGLKYSRFYGSFNTYYTAWQNQPQFSKTDPITGALYVSNGIDVIYKGVEFEGTYKPIKQIEIEGVLSFGDWRYNSGSEIYGYNSDNVIVTSLTYDAKGVHVGNAAQNQMGLAIRYMPFKGLYIKPRVTRFDKNYAGINAIDLNNKPDVTGKIIDNRGKESWRLPAYYLFDLSAGYELPFKAFKVNIYGTINNVLNFRYITDAQNNGAYQNSNGFNAASASVFFGVGRTYTFGTKLTF
ncbi:MAG: TonB-dependent receptor plug domain-containing protein [Burkholderiales bacterium]|nr:TonB-dependent receptor plug domain-containing protein [Bacteroidia bacterium]